MLAIRLSRTGRNKYPTYRIVAAESARAATGKFVAILGHYNPHTKELVIKHDETLKYLGHGAQPSNSVIKLLQREKIKLPDWVTLKTRHTAPKKEPAAKPEPTSSPSGPSEAVAAETEAAESSVINDSSETTPVAAIAAEHSQTVEAKAPNSTDLDSDHTETAASQSDEADKAQAAENTAAKVAIDQPDDTTTSK